MLKLLTADGLRDKISSTSHLNADDCILYRQIDSRSPAESDVSTLENGLHVSKREDMEMLF